MLEKKSRHFFHHPTSSPPQPLFSVSLFLLPPVHQTEEDTENGIDGFMGLVLARELDVGEYMPRCDPSRS